MDSPSLSPWTQAQNHHQGLRLWGTLPLSPLSSTLRPSPTTTTPTKLQTQRASSRASNTRTVQGKKG